MIIVRFDRWDEFIEELKSGSPEDRVVRLTVSLRYNGERRPYRTLVAGFLSKNQIVEYVQYLGTAVNGERHDEVEAHLEARRKGARDDRLQGEIGPVSRATKRPAAKAGEGMIGTLLAHTGAVRVNRAELAAIEPPASTRTWKPVRHGELVEALEAELGRRDLKIREEGYAVQKDGAVLFGVIDLFWRETDEFAAAIGLRTANDRTMSIQIAVGFRVFVCDNLVFAGDLIALRRKHTAGLDLPREIARAIDRYQEGTLSLERGIAHFQEAEIADVRAKELIFDAFDQVSG